MVTLSTPGSVWRTGQLGQSIDGQRAMGNELGPAGAEARHILLTFSARLKRLRKKSGSEEMFAKNIPQGLKPMSLLLHLARINPCPFKTSPPSEFFCKL